MKRKRHSERGQQLQPCAGHSLHELLVAMLVWAALTGLAAPAMHTWALDLQLQTTLDELARGLALARSEALATGRVVEFRFRALPAGQRVAINRTAILFSPSGNATPATLTLCDRRSTGRSLVVARSGRVRAASGQCGYALAEVLAGLLLLAVSALALAQGLLQARHTVTTSALQSAALDALGAANEGSRLLGTQTTFPAEAAALAAVWRATYGGGGLSTGAGTGTGTGTGTGAGTGTGNTSPSAIVSPTLLLSWQPVASDGGWLATAATGGLELAMESHP